MNIELEVTQSSTHIAGHFQRSSMFADAGCAIDLNVEDAYQLALALLAKVGEALDFSEQCRRGL